jgi:hypothetical protein
MLNIKLKAKQSRRKKKKERGKKKEERRPRLSTTFTSLSKYIFISSPVDSSYLPHIYLKLFLQLYLTPQL